MAKTKFSIWRYIICEICKKNGSNRPFLASRVADTIFPPPIEGYHRQLDNQCKDPMDNKKDCRVGQLTNPLHDNFFCLGSLEIIQKVLNNDEHVIFMAGLCQSPDILLIQAGRNTSFTLGQ